MSLEKRVYSVLLVSAQESFNTAMTEMLPKSSYYPVKFTSSISSAKRQISDREYDFVIVNSPLPDGNGANFAIDTCKTNSSAVLFLIRNELYSELREKVYVHGVFTLSKPTSKPTILTALNWLSSAREKLRSFEKKTISIEEKMEEIRIVNRAKWLLISQLNMDEPEAHRHIEKTAMDRCISRKAVAEEIINTYK